MVLPSITDRLRAFPDCADPDFAVDTFQSSLVDPHTPQHCAQCLMGCLMCLMDPSVGLHNYTVLRVDRPAFLDTGARFITVLRSDEENERLQDEMNVCKCNLSDIRMKQLHDVRLSIDVPSESCTYHLLGRTIASLINNVLQLTQDEGKLYKTEKDQLRAARRGKPVPWPRSPQDVLPCGVDASIAALAAWTELYFGDTMWLALFGNIITLFKKEVVLAILASPTLPGAFVGFAEVPFLMLTGELQLTYPYEDLVTLIMYSALLYKVLVYFFDRDECRILFDRANAQFLPEDLDRNLLSVCKDGLALMPTVAGSVPLNSTIALHIQYCIEDFLLAGTFLHYNLNLPYDTEKYGIQIVERVQQLRDMESISPEYMAYLAFLRLWDLRRCWSPGCRETFAGAGRAFAVCSGCKRITYCSKECLARAWKHEDVPHRAICKKIKYIADATDLDSKPKPENVVLFRIVCALRKVEAAVLTDFNKHFAKLEEYMSLAPHFTEAQGELLATTDEAASCQQ